MQPNMNLLFRPDIPGPQGASCLDKVNCPPWRQFDKKLNDAAPAKAVKMDERDAKRGMGYQSDQNEALLVSAALHLRRPLLVTGPAGAGKTTLAYAVAWQLGLGNVLHWAITSRSTLQEGLYHYDAIARLNDAALAQTGKVQGIDPNDIGRYIRLGPLGTALLPNPTGPYRPRVLLIDEIDKSDMDLPNDLLHVFEEGWYPIPEISRMPSAVGTAEVQVEVDPKWQEAFTEGKTAIPRSGMVKCHDFPLVIMTSNGERDFPPAFLRRCLRLDIPLPSSEKLLRLVKARFQAPEDDKPASESAIDSEISKLVTAFEKEVNESESALATDQLLNAIFLAKSSLGLNDYLQGQVLRTLSERPLSIHAKNRKDG